MNRVQIKTDRDNCVHLDYGNGMDSTLCGLKMMGDQRFDIEPAKVVQLRVNCPTCLQMIEACNLVPKRWIGRANQGGE